MQTQVRVAAIAAALVALAACATAGYPGGSPRLASGVSPLVVFSPPPGMVTFTSPLPMVNESSGPISTQETTQINSVQVAPGGLELNVNFVSGACDLGASAYADETNDEVDVHVLVTSVEATCPAIGYGRTIAVALKAPLAGRRIIYETEAGAAVSYAPGVAPSTSAPPAIAS